jgi:corrinoid protein of di/trimethylamine methyltransferase
MLTHTDILEKVRQAIIDGESEDAQEFTQQALQAGLGALQVLNEGLMAGADYVGQKFETGEFFLPELMLTGRALKAAMQILTPFLESQDAGQGRSHAGVVVMATIQTDIHDIGKNIVASMLTASGFQVVDLGVDVPIKEIVNRAKAENADIIACSALLTTSMPYMRDLLGLIEAMGERQRFKVMVGGASVTPEFCASIGADGTAPNALEAVKLAKQLLQAQPVTGED